MSTKGVLAGAVLLLALAGLVYWSKSKEAAETGKGPDEKPALVAFKTGDLQRIAIARLGEPATVLERNASGAWQIAAPQQARVDTSAVDDLLNALLAVRADPVIEEKAGDLQQFGLGTPAVEVTLTEKSGAAKRFLIGDETVPAGSYYAMAGGDPRVITVAAGTRTSIDKSWKDLQDKRLLTFDDQKLTRIELSPAAIEFGKNASGEWQIVKPRPLRSDNGQIEELLRKLKDARMETAAPEEEAQKTAAKFGSASKVAAVTVTDASGAQTLEVRKSGDDYLAKSTVAAGVHKIGSDLGEALGKKLDDFRNKKLFDFGWNDPSKVEIRDGAKTYSFTKGGEKWWAAGKEMDATSVQSLIDKLRDLGAISFAESGFTTAAMEIAVTSNDGKRTERVQISQTGSKYFAKRENEPSVYEIDAKRLEEVRTAAADVKGPSVPAKQ